MSKLRDRFADALVSFGTKQFARADELAGAPNIRLSPADAAGLARDVFDEFKDRGVERASSYPLGLGHLGGQFGIRVDLKAQPGAEQLSAEIKEFIASKTKGRPHIYIDWQGAAQGLVGPVKQALGSRASDVRAEQGTLIVEASTTTKDLDAIRRQVEAQVQKQVPGLPVVVRPFSSAVSFGANTFRDDD
jgi:hypothetical protein